MKIRYFYASLLIFMFSEIIGFSQKAEQKILVSLNPGEELMYYESCIPLSFTDGEMRLVTSSSGKYYVYENGSRKGPYSKADEIGLNDCNSSDYYIESCEILRNESENYQKYVTAKPDGTVIIKFKDKTISGFSSVDQIKESANGTKISAVGIDENWQPLFLTPAGKLISIEGESAGLIMSASGNLAILTVKGNTVQNMDSYQDQTDLFDNMQNEMESANMDQMTPEQMVKFMDNLQKKYGIQQDYSQNEDAEYYLYLSDGRKLGPFVNKQFNTDNPAFTKDGGDNWYFTINGKLYINGTLVKDFGDEVSLSNCSIWISSDGKRHAALINYDHLEFSDGQSYDAPIQIKSEMQNGKNVLTWLGLNASNQLILYKKTL